MIYASVCVNVTCTCKLMVIPTYTDDESIKNVFITHSKRFLRLGGLDPDIYENNIDTCRVHVAYTYILMLYYITIKTNGQMKT